VRRSPFGMSICSWRRLSRSASWQALRPSAGGKRFDAMQGRMLNSIAHLMLRPTKVVRPTGSPIQDKETA